MMNKIRRRRRREAKTRGEDAGSGAWTIGHAGSRGFARGHARTRGFTRVRVLTLNSIHWTHKRTEEVRKMDKIRRR